MDWIKLPDQGTIAYAVVTAAIAGLLIGVFGKRFGEFVLDLILAPFRYACTALYNWIAPRNPFSISLRTYRKHLLRSNLTRMENPVGPGLDVPLEHAFAPLKLSSGAADEAIDLFSYVSINHRCIILGGPGTGKTTLMKSLVTSVARKRCHEELNELIPIFVVLRNLAKAQHSVTDAIVAGLADHHFPGAINFVQSSLNAGRLLIILDGLDEVGANREFVVDQILAFCSHDSQRNHKNKVLVTCRAHSYRAKDLHNEISNILQVEPFANHHMRIFLEGWPKYKGRSAITLFGLIQSDPQIRDICRNPLLLTILTGLFLDNDNFELPSSRESFYQNAVDELLLHRPARRQIKQNFNIDDKRQLLARVALDRLETVGRNEDPEELTHSSFKKKLEEIAPNDKINIHDLLKELVDINGIIKPLHDDSYTCAHRTILEFFAAREALRSRETATLLETFTARLELIEVLYFYCSLLRNLPALTTIVDSLAREKRWLEAGRCLLYMYEAPKEATVEDIAFQLYTAVIAEGETKASLELLSSLANRRDGQFEGARRFFAKAIEQLTESDESGASALESAIAASPEIALKLIPGLLKHPAERWKAAGVQLLKDVGVDEALDQLVQLLRHNDPYVRSRAGFVLAEMIISRNADLRHRAALLPERTDNRVWPLETFFPGTIAIPIAEAVAPSTSGPSEAINCAVRALAPASPKQLEDVLAAWWRIPRDLALHRVRRALGASLLAGALCLSIIFPLMLFSLQYYSWRTNQNIAVSFSPIRATSFSREPMNKFRADLNGSLREIQVKTVSEPWRLFVQLFPPLLRYWMPEKNVDTYFKLLSLGYRADSSEFKLNADFWAELQELLSADQIEVLKVSLSAVEASRPPEGASQIIAPRESPFVLVLGAAMSTMMMVAPFYVFRRWIVRRRTVEEKIGDDDDASRDRLTKFRGKMLSIAGSPKYVFGFILVSACISFFLVVGGGVVRSFSPYMLVFGGMTLLVVFGWLARNIDWPNNPLLVTIAEVQGVPMIYRRGR